MCRTNYGYVKLSLIQISGYISLPALMIGFMLAQNYGFGAACSSILLANLIIALLAIPIASNAPIHKQTATERVRSLFGSNGSKISALALCIVLIGWFGINIEAASEALKSSANIDTPIINLIVGTIITLIVTYGIKGLEKVAILVVPIFIMAIICSLVVMSDRNVIFELGMPDAGALMIALAAPFTILFDLPTYYRFAKSKLDSALSVIISLFIAMSSLEIIGAIFATITQGKKDIIDALLNSGSVELTLINLGAILLGTLIVNNCNLYSASANAKVLLGKLSFKQTACLLGAIGTLTSYLGVIENLEFTLEGITILIGSITSLLVLEAMLKTKFKCELAVPGIIIGSIFGFLALFEVIKTSIAAFLLAGVITASIAIIEIKINSFMRKKDEPQTTQ